MIVDSGVVVSLTLWDVVVSAIIFGLFFYTPILSDIMVRTYNIKILGEELILVIGPIIAFAGFYTGDWQVGMFGVMASAGYASGLSYLHKRSGQSNLARNAKRGYPTAQLLLGTSLIFGINGYKQNTEEGLRWLLEAAENGDSGAQAELGTFYREGWFVTKNLTEALRWFRLAASQGNPGAENAIGKMYREGMSLPKDSAQAAEWFLKSASKGYRDAQLNIADAYLTGDGVTKDYHASMEWYLQCAHQGDPICADALSYLFENGLGVNKDLVAAVMWRLVAGNEAEADRIKQKNRLAPAQLLEARLLAEDWRSRYPISTISLVEHRGGSI